VTHLLADLRYAARSIARMPALAAVVIGSLAIGIGANAVVFSWMESIVFKPLPAVPDSGALYTIEPRKDAGVYVGASWLDYRDLRERVRSVDSLFAFRMAPLYVGERGQVERSNGLMVSDNYFAALGLTPAAGRFFRADEVSVPGTAPVTVISYDYWQTRYAGSAAAVGRHIRINGSDLAIVGVAPRGFNGSIMRLSFDVGLPATHTPTVFNGSRELAERATRGFTIGGRLAHGVARDRAQTEVSSVMRALAVSYPQTNRGLDADVLAFWEAARGPQRFLTTSLAVLQGLMLLLLFAVCGNTANLMLARATSRQREMSVRQALGARPWRIASLLLSENLMLALAGGALGAALASWGTHTLNAMPPLRVRGIPISFETNVDATTIAFAILLGVLCGILFGLLPAIQLARQDPQASLRAGFNTPRRSRSRSLLVAAEVALAITVLIASALFIRDFMATRHEDPGFTREGVLLAGLDLSGRGMSDDDIRKFDASLIERLAVLPSIEAAALATSVPLDIHGMPMRAFTVEGHARADDGYDETFTDTVTPGYFDVMKIPFLAGRDFAPIRDAAAPPQVIVNGTFVRRYLDGASALGRRVEVRGKRYAIVGVVRDSIYNAFDEPPASMLYFSLRDRPAVVGDLHVRVRSGVETAVATDIRRVVADLNPELPVYDLRTLSDHIEANLIFRRIPARLFSVLAPLLLLLAASGIYAVVSYSVSLRTQEFGVRLALGATATRLVARCVGEHLVVIGTGALAGWLIALAVVVDVLGSRVDAGVFAGVPALLIAVAAAASWWPARRIAQVHPVVALRSE
jgi:predicted permease